MPELKTPSVPALERALEILELLSSSRSGMALPEISNQLQLPRSSVHCLLLTLERHGYLHRNERTNRYLFGSKLFSLANTAINGLELHEVAAPFLQQLMEHTRLTVHLAILERHEAVLIEKVEPPSALRIATWLGKRMEVHCTGVGKALIAYLPDGEIEHLARTHGLPRHNDDTIVSLRKLRDELIKVRRLGYAIDDEEDEIGFRCIAAPVFDRSGGAVAAISISGTILQVREDNSEVLALEVKQAADAISKAKGYVATLSLTSQVGQVSASPPKA